VTATFGLMRACKVSCTKSRSQKVGPCSACQSQGIDEFGLPNGQRPRTPARTPLTGAPHLQPSHPHGQQSGHPGFSRRPRPGADAPVWARRRQRAVRVRAATQDPEVPEPRGFGRSRLWYGSSSARVTQISRPDLAFITQIKAL